MGDGRLRRRFGELDGRLGGAHARIADFGGLRIVEVRTDELHVLEVARLQWDLFPLL